MSLAHSFLVQPLHPSFASPRTKNNEKENGPVARRRRRLRSQPARLEAQAGERQRERERRQRENRGNKKKNPERGRARPAFLPLGPKIDPENPKLEKNKSQAKSATFFKPQTLTFTNGGSNVESLPSQREREDEAQQRAEEARRAKKAAEAAAAAVATSSIPAPSKPAPSSSSFPVPRYVANAGVVLRYRGWFCEPVPAGSSRLEARAGGAGDPPSPFAFAPPPPASSSSSRTDGGAGARVRQVELRLYLEDNTADVVERREPNSGLEQGLIARRHALSRRALVAKGGSATTAPRRGGGGGDGDDGADPFAPRLKTEVDAPLRPEDIRVGDVIDVFGRRITVADADAATRAWLLSRAAGDERKSPSTDSSSSPSDSSSDSSSPQFARLPGDAIPVPEGDYEVAMRAAAAGKGFFERGSKEEGGKERERGEKMGASFLKLRPPPRQKTQTQNSQTLKQTNKNSPRARQGPQPRRDLWERSGGAPLGQAAGPGRRYV